MLQTIVISKKNYTLNKAKTWLIKRGYKSDVDMKTNSYRFRQREPGQFEKFYTVKVAPGINFVFGKK